MPIDNPRGLPFLSPERPILAGLPLMLNPRTGEFFQTVLPAIMISQRPDHFDVWAFLPAQHDAKASSPKSFKAKDIHEVSWALHRWFSGPEAFAIDYMGWEPPDGRRTPSQPTSSEISLDDIDFT